MSDGTTPPTRRRLHGFRWYASEPGATTWRRPTDILLLVAALAGMALLAVAAPGPTQVDQGLVTIVEAIPDWIAWFFDVGYALAALWAMALVVVALAGRGRRVLALHLLLSAALALGVAMVVGALSGTGWDRSWAALWSSEPPPVYTAVRVAVITAVIVTASPQLTRPVRILGRLLLTVLGVAAVFVGVAYPIGAVAGFLAGVAAGATTHLLLGSPGGRPSAERVAEALEDLGLSTQVSELPYRPGAALFAAEVPDRPPLRVAVLGRDEWDAQVAGSAWTAATRRGGRLTLGTTRQARVEHAAMSSLLAQRAGVRVLPVVAAGRSEEGDALLVTEAPRADWADLAPGDITDEMLDDAWDQVLALHAIGTALGAVDDRHLALDREGRVALVGFDSAVPGASPADLAIDRVQLLVTTALVTDDDRAVAVAERALGADGLAGLLPYVQPAVLDRRSRRLIRDEDWDVASLRERLVAATGVEPPPLEQITRVSGRALLRVVLILALVIFLISSLSGVDFSTIWQEIATADWAWLAAALLVSPIAQVFFAFSTLGSTAASLRYFPTLMLQYAVQFLALVVPSTGARLAMDVRFFQSFGIAGGAAISMGMIDSFSGFIVQILLLVVILVSGLPGFTQPLSTGSSDSGSDSGSSTPSLLALAVVLAVISLVVVLVVPRLRRRFTGRIREGVAAARHQLGEARGAFDIVRQPRKVGQMLVGNLGAQVVQAVVLGLCLAAFGQTAHLSQLILINTAVSLFAGLMPVPGGMGVAEAGYTAGLQAIGIPSSVAISTAIAFRLVTFYLPPLWGSVAMRWLRRHSYL